MRVNNLVKLTLIIGLVLCASGVASADTNWTVTSQTDWDSAQYSSVNASIDNGRLMLPAESYNISVIAYGGNMSVASRDDNPVSVEFNNNGTKMFFFGNEYDTVYEYHLSTPYDISTATYDSSFDASSEINTADGMTFSNDGSKMFLEGIDNDIIVRYDLSTPFNVSTASYVSNMSTRNTTNYEYPYGLDFGNDGLRLYVVYGSGQIVDQYNLTIAYNLSTAVLNSTIDTNCSEPRGITFNDDGSKMYVAGEGGVFEHTLSTPWEITTATFRDKSSTIGRSEPDGITFTPYGGINGSRFFCPRNNFLTGVHDIYWYSTNVSAGSWTSEWHNWGGSTRIKKITQSIGAVGSGLQVKVQASDDGSTVKSDTGWLSITSTGTITNDFADISGQYTRVKYDLTAGSSPIVQSYNLTVSGDPPTPTNLQNITGNFFIKYDWQPRTGIDTDYFNATIADVSSGWSLSLIKYIQSHDISSQTTGPTGLTCIPNGTKFYVSGGDNIYEYNLSTPWDISTANYLFNISATGPPALRGVKFNDNGTKMYTVEGDATTWNDHVVEYDLTEAWNVSTASQVNSFNVSADLGTDTFPQGVALKSDGKKLYVIDSTSNTNKTYEYDLTEPWNISTAQYRQSSDITGSSLIFGSDGTRIYTGKCAGDNKICEFNLETAWNISTVTETQSFNANNQDSSLGHGLVVKPDDGTKLYATGTGNDYIYEYNLTLGIWQNSTSTSWNLTTLEPHGYAEIEVYSYNSTYDEFNTTPASANITIPNNPITLTDLLTSYNVKEQDTFKVDANRTDLDGDTPTFGTNATNGTFYSSNGTLIWNTGIGDEGTYNWYINVSDSYGSTDMMNFTLDVAKTLFYVKDMSPKLWAVRSDTFHPVNYSTTADGQYGEENILLGLNQSNNFVGKYTINFTANISFQNVTMGIDTSAPARSFIHGTSGIPNITSKSLLVGRNYFYDKVYVCPDATTLSEVSPDCPKKVTLDVGETTNGYTLSETIINDTKYYKVAGITGTGAGEVKPPNPYIKSIYNSATEDDSESFTISPDTTVYFKATASQAVMWYWDGVASYTGDGTTSTTGERTFSSTGNYTVSVYGSNQNGSTSTVTWSVAVVKAGAAPTPTEVVGPAPTKPSIWEQIKNWGTWILSVLVIVGVAYLARVIYITLTKGGSKEEQASAVIVGTAMIAGQLYTGAITSALVSIPVEAITEWLWLIMTIILFGLMIIAGKVGD